MNLEITKNGRTWIDLGDGYYGLKVAPGCPEDSSQGKVGIQHFYPQYAPKSDLLTELLTNILPEFSSAAAEAAQKKQEDAAAAREAAQRADGKCPRCGTWCYGDCQSQ